jgi:hypothetical protein
VECDFAIFASTLIAHTGERSRDLGFLQYSIAVSIVLGKSEFLCFLCNTRLPFSVFFFFTVAPHFNYKNIALTGFHLSHRFAGNMTTLLLVLVPVWPRTACATWHHCFTTASPPLKHSPAAPHLLFQGGERRRTRSCRHFERIYGHFRHL